MPVKHNFLDMAAYVGDYIAPSLARDWPLLPVERAEGAYLYLADDRKVLDFTSGIATANTGYGHPKVLAAAQAQIARFTHSAIGVTLHEPLFRLCEELREILPGGMDMFFFSNSGAEAVEGAVKLAKYVTGRPGVISFMGGFHGRTYGAMTMTTSKAKYRLHYEGLMPSSYVVPFADCYHCRVKSCDDPCCGLTATGGLTAAGCEALAYLDDVFARVIDPSQVACLVVEPIQGEGGYNVPPAEFLAGLRERCDRHGILLIFDEVQTGFGRTGEWFAARTFGVTPDIFALAKGIASGFPLSAVAAPSRLMREWKPGAHGTTFGGNPVSCAAAVATIQVIREEQLIENCREQGERIMARLTALKERSPHIGDVRGKGLMIGVEFVSPPANGGGQGGAIVQRVLDGCLERGLLCYMAGLYGQVIRIIPPLIVTREQVDQAMDVFEEVVMGLEG
jgi:4-aminobutyrate aminotransferase